MTKNYFDPAHARFVSPITGKSYRANRSLRFGSACFKTDAEGDTDEEKAAKEELLKQVQTRTKAEMETRGWTDPFKKSVDKMIEDWGKFPLEAIRSLADPKEGILAKLSVLEANFEKLDNSAEGSEGKRLSVRSQIAAWQKSAGIESDPNKPEFGAWKKKEVGHLPELSLDLRAVHVPMTPANTLAGAAPYLPIIEWDMNLNDIPRYELTFWDYITKGKTNSAAFGWVNKTNVQGAAGFIGPGELKPYISFDIVAETSTPKKVAAVDKVAQELLDDIDGMESWIKDELRYQVLLAVNTVLMSGVGSATTPTGIENLSVAYTNTQLKTTNPNNADVLRAVVAQMRSGKIKGNITIFVNPIDIANMEMQKTSTNGSYIMPPFLSSDGRTIAGARIVEDNNIAIGHFQAAFLQYYVIKIYKPLVIDFGYENDDFRKNLLTYRAEMRIHQIFNDQYTGAFVYDTYANVKAMLVA